MESFIVNPFCVSALPEAVRLGFLRKVFGIMLSQLLLLFGVMCATKFSGLGAMIINVGNAWVPILLTQLPFPLLLCIYAARKRHPWNLILFTLFTISFGVTLGTTCAYINSYIFIMSTAGSILSVAAAFALTFWKGPNDLSFRTGLLFSVATAVIAGGLTKVIFPSTTAHMPVGAALVSFFFSCWIMWDIQAIQIDLTADEYIVAAVDLYLDIINMFMWLMICMLYCLEAMAMSG